MCKPSLPHPLSLLASLLLSSLLPAPAQLTWDFSTENPTSGIPLHLAAGPISQGNTTGAPPLLSTTSASSTYPGASGGNNAGLAARTGPLNLNPGTSPYFELTLSPASGYQLTLTNFTFGSRRTSTGPQKYSLRSSADGFATEIAGGNLLANATNWALYPNLGLSLRSLSPLTLRLYGYDGVGSPNGTSNWRLDDLSLAADLTPSSSPIPTLTSFFPPSGPVGTSVTILGTHFGTAPTVSFNGTLATFATANPDGTSITATAPLGGSSGPLTVLTALGSVSSDSSYTYPPQPALSLTTEAAAVPENAALLFNAVARPADAPLDLPLTVDLLSSNPLKATVPATVTIPVGQLVSESFAITGVPDGAFSSAFNVTLTASASGYLSATVLVSVTNVDAPPPAAPPTVVINKWLNSSPEIVELLVVGDGSPHSTVDLRGMILKDFSSSMSKDGGGKKSFADAPLFQALPAGTLLVLTNQPVSSDLDPADFVLRLGLADPAFFIPGSGTFDLSAQEMVMLKAPGSPAAGTDGAIHALAVGSSDPSTYPLFANTTSAKLFATGANSALAQNSAAALDDFNGADAAPSPTLSAAQFGAANTPTNHAFLRSLRGITSLSGVGQASLVNHTPNSPFLDRNIFPRNQSAQQVALTLLSDVSPGTLTRCSVIVPSALGAPLPSQVAISGPGAGAPLISVSGQTIAISGTAITATDPAIITLSGLSTPSPSGPEADGRYPFLISTAGPSDSPAPLAAAPAAVVIVPIQSLRDVDPLTGVPVDLHKIVAVEGVVTEENFHNAQLSAFLQDGDFAINVFSYNLASFPALTRGQRYAVTGPILQFAGLTEISPASGADLIDLGPGIPPLPLALTAAQLAAPSDPSFLENIEGRLIRVDNLTLIDGTWTDPPTTTTIDLTLRDPLGNHLSARLAQNTAATTPPAAYPASITGIFSQAAPANAPFSGYLLMPRDPDDVASSPVSSYQLWASAFPAIGAPSDDSDGDGQSNFLEYALGTLPSDPASLQTPAVVPIAGRPGFALTKGPAAAADPSVAYLIEGSSDLHHWSHSLPDIEVLANDNTSYRVQYLGDSPHFFFRLKVGPP